MSEFNLKSSHVSILYHLYRSGGVTAKDLCNLGQEDKASISRSIEYLENNDYILSDTSQKKKYNTLLVLTQKGKEIATKVCQKIDKILSIVAGMIPEEKKLIMYECLNTINRNLEKLCRKYKGE